MTTFRRLIVALAGLLALSTISALPAEAKPTPPPPAKSTPRAAAAGEDLSGTMPRALRDEVTSDFMGLGYEQRMRAENSSLNIYDPPDRGGKLRKSIPQDLSVAPSSVGSYSTWGWYTNDRDLSCYACIAGTVTEFHVNTIYLEIAEGFLYMTGVKGNFVTTNLRDPNRYRNLIYRVPLAGLSCATEACVRQNAQQGGVVHDLPSLYPDAPRTMAVTALAVGYSGDNLLVAVGLSDTGVQILDRFLNYRSTYTGFSTPQGGQTPPTALAFDPGGSGLLAVMVMSYWNIAYFVQVDAYGALSGSRNWDTVGYDQLWNVPMAVSWMHDSAGSLLAAVGLAGGPVVLLDPGTSAGGVRQVASYQLPPNLGAAVVNPIPRLDGQPGDDLAVATMNRGSLGSFGTGTGFLLRYNNAAGTLVPQPLVAGGGAQNIQLGTLDAFRSWFPGYRTGRLTISNPGTEDLTVRLAASGKAGEGCWFAPAFADAPAFPDQPTTIAAGANSTYTFGYYTAAPDGSCGTAVDQLTGAWRGYLAITPVDEPGNTRLVNLQVSRQTLQVSTSGSQALLSDQAGGPLSVAAQQQPTSPQSGLGNWRLTVSSPTAPTLATAPKVTGNLLVRPVAGVTRNPVYRFDVSTSTWTLPAAPSGQNLNQVTVPPLRVVGSNDQSSWTTLGTFMPVGALTRSGSTLTVGGGSFFWENTTGASYRYFGVWAPTQTAASNTVDTTTLTAPAAAPTGNATITLKPTTNQSGTAGALGNGVDQAQVQVIINIGSPIPTNNPIYQTVYYRDDDGDLITNLYQPGAYADFVGVQPSAGAYPNTGATSTRTAARPGVAGPSYDYVSVVGTELVSLNAYLGVKPETLVTGTLAVQGSDRDFEPTSPNGAADGVSLEGCADYSGSTSCRLAATSTRPALYQAGSAQDGPVLGVQLVTEACNAISDLPLLWQDTDTTGQALKAAAVSFPASLSAQLELSNPGDYPGQNDRVDIGVVSHGQFVPITVPVN